MANSKEKLKLIFFHSSLVGFCEFVREQIENVDDDKGMDQIMKNLILGAKSELLDIRVNVTKKELKLLQKHHHDFFDRHIEQKSYLLGFNFYLAKIEDFLGAVSTGKRKGGISSNPKRIARLEQMQGLLTTALDILGSEYEQHKVMDAEQIDGEAEKAADAIQAYETLFDRRAA